MITLHGTCVAYDGRGVLLRGASGCGKSATGLMLMGLGCGLVADDRTTLHRAGDRIIATCPATIRGSIEARGIGLLAATPVDQARLALVVDLDVTATTRLPKRRTVTFLGNDIPLIDRVPDPHLVPAILQFLKSGWSPL